MTFAIVAIVIAAALLGVMAYAYSRRDRPTRRQREHARAAYLRDVKRDQ